MSFKIGDRVVPFVPTGQTNWDTRSDCVIGTEGVITGFNCVVPKCTVQVRFSHYPEIVHCHPLWLKKIDEGYDGNRIVTWDSCPWQPAQVSS